jgi:hypothetical protein
VREQISRKRGTSSVLKINGERGSIEFGVENGYEDDNCQAEEGEHAEGEIADKMDRLRDSLSVDIKQAYTAGNEKNECYYRQKDNHNRPHLSGERII